MPVKILPGQQTAETLESVTTSMTASALEEINANIVMRQRLPNKRRTDREANPGEPKPVPGPLEERVDSSTKVSDVETLISAPGNT